MHCKIKAIGNTCMCNCIFNYLYFSKSTCTWDFNINYDAVTFVDQEQLIVELITYCQFVWDFPKVSYIQDTMMS